jgi:hypothetical protein
VICSFGFRRVLPSHLFYYLGGSFFLCRRKLISRRQCLAILAHTTFHVLYDDVANGWVDVANSQYQCNRTDNFIAVSGPSCIGKKESLAKHLNLHWGNPATVFVGLKQPVPVVRL